MKVLIAILVAAVALMYLVAAVVAEIRAQWEGRA
jgi:hypothetical protein